MKSQPNQMTNSHILVQDFDFFEPVTIEEAVQLVDKFGDRARVLAGGTDLFVMMKVERISPDVIISLHKISGLDQIQIDKNGDVSIGALTTILALRDHPVIKRHYEALSKACHTFSALQVETMGTVGGNICNGSPAADSVPALLVLGAVAEIQGPQGSRGLPLEEFFLGPGLTALKRGEILVSITLPKPSEKMVSDYVKVARIAADLAKASLGITLVRSGNTIVDCRVAAGSVAPTPRRLYQVEEVLVGQTYSQVLVNEAGRLAGEEISPISDARSTSWYRRQVIDVMLRDLLERAWQSAGDAVVSEPDGYVSLPVQDLPSAVESKNYEQGKKHAITLNVNGNSYPVQVYPNELLMNVLREHLSLTGTKYGCGIGECGACTVLIDGVPKFSCLTLAIDAVGKEVTSIEGLQGLNGELDPIQQAFIDHAAFQCGYCTPGIIMALKGLIKDNPHPNEEEVRDALKGNRCRCTGYVSITRAVLAVTGENSQ